MEEAPRQTWWARFRSPMAAIVLTASAWIISPWFTAYNAGFLIPEQHSENNPKADLASELTNAVLDQRWSNYFPPVSDGPAAPAECESYLPGEGTNSTISNILFENQIHYSLILKNIKSAAFAFSVENSYSSNEITLLLYCIRFTEYSDYCEDFVVNTVSAANKKLKPETPKYLLSTLRGIREQCRYLRLIHANSRKAVQPSQD